MSRIPLFVVVLTAILLLGGLATAQDSATEPPPQPTADATAVDFFLPGHFKEALKAAIDHKRLLVIKGVAFGMDGLGASCATRGHW